MCVGVRYVCMCTVCVSGACGGQKRTLEPITDGCEPPCRCWELNSSPLEEQIANHEGISPALSTFFLDCGEIFNDLIIPTSLLPRLWDLVSSFDVTN